MRIPMPRPFSRMVGAVSKQRSRSFHLSAPVGGINTVSPASRMDATDCLYLFNLIPFQYGLRVRSGWHEHATNVLPEWQAYTDYLVGAVVYRGAYQYICVYAGTSGAFGPSGLLPPGTAILDGTCSWAGYTTADLYQDSSPLMANLAATLGGARIGAWTGAMRPGVRSLLAFYGSSDKGLNDRFFACTKEGIWDVSNPTSAPTLAYTFEAQDLTSGVGVATAFTNVAGEHFLAYCDETNGYLLYRESTDSWTRIIETPQTAWKPSTAYAVGDFVVNYGLAFICTKAGTSQEKWLPDTAYAVGDRRANGFYIYEVTAAGTSATAGGPTGTGNVISDGTVTWKYATIAGPASGETNIIDGTATWDYYPSISGADPTRFRLVMSWKNRLWFVSSNSAEATYLPIGQYAGSVDNNDVRAGGTVNFGARFKYGGNLVGLWNWTVDGGQGIDDHLVGISSAGDVVIYTGTDPAIPGEFGLKGVWWVGPVPPGRKIASSFGGDLFILARIGCLPLSKLVAGYMIRDPNIYATAKISNLFNVFMTERGDLPGWEINMHPTDNLLMITVPASPNKVQEQLAMSMASKGWARLTGIPMTCMETWRGKLYFGTADSRVCVNEGNVDGDTLDHTTMWGIDFSLLTSFQSLGSSQKKRVHMIRPLFMTDGTNPGYSTESRWDFDISTVDPMPVLAGLLDTSVWDQGVWDTNKWHDGIDKGGQYYGASGMGTHAAMILRGSASTPTTFVGFDVVLDQGGIL